MRSKEAKSVSGQRSEEYIREFHRVLSDAWGPQHWWPAQTRFEVIVGAYLTQNTAWTNVERAMKNLQGARVLSVKGIREISIAELETLIRSAGYFRQKSKRLKTFISYLDANYRGSLDGMFSQSTQKLRDELLALNGVGPETADSILLYAGNHPVFVVDAYTRRILDRHAILPLTAPYEDIRMLFERALAGIETAQASQVRVPHPSAQSKDGSIRGAAYEPSRMSLSPQGAGPDVQRNACPDCRSREELLLQQEPGLRSLPAAQLLTCGLALALSCRTTNYNSTKPFKD